MPRPDRKPAAVIGWTYRMRTLGGPRLTDHDRVLLFPDRFARHAQSEQIHPRSTHGLEAVPETCEILLSGSPQHLPSTAR
jgi:hypothetical protein